MSVDERDHYRLAVARKAIREQPSALAASAVWRAIRDTARAHALADGFVDWRTLEPLFERAFEDSPSPETGPRLSPSVRDLAAEIAKALWPTPVRLLRSQAERDVREGREQLIAHILERVLS